MNPMIGKELRQRMRERRGWILPSLYLLALGAVLAFAYFMLQESGGGREVQGFQIGVGMFLTAAYAQLALLLLLAPIFSAGALTLEKEQRTLSGLLSSLLGPANIWWGKFVASLLYVLLLLVAGLPVLSAAFAFGGVGPAEVGIVTVTIVIVLASVSAVSLYWSSAFRRSVHATAVSYVSVIVMTFVTLIVFSLEIQRADPRTAWASLPVIVRAPLYFNPFFFLTMAFQPVDKLYPEWFKCVAVFVLLGIICVLLTLRNLRRAGEDLQ